MTGKPERPTEWSSSVSKPSEAVSDNPERVIVALVETDAKEFTEAVALKPVKPTTSAGVTDPKDVVADKPVILNTADSTVPQPFWPQLSVPQPGFTSINSVKLPTVDVADRPVRVITSSERSPHSLAPQALAPQPIVTGKQN